MGRQVFALLIVLASAARGVAAADAWEPLARRLTPGGSGFALALTATLCDYLTERGLVTRGELSAVTTPAELRALLASKTSKDLIEIGDEMFEWYAARAERESSAQTPWVAHTSAHYVILARKGTAPERDLAAIGEELETCREALIGALGLAAGLAEREELLLAGLPDEVGGLDGSGRIAVYLHARRRDAAKGDLGKHGFGASRFGATLTPEGGLRLRGTIHVLYVNAFSLFVLQHEVSHLAVLLASFDPAAAKGSVRGEPELRAAFTRGYHSPPTFVMEGLGDYGFFYQGFYPRWGLLGPPEPLAQELRATRKLPSLTDLLTAEPRSHAADHKAFSLAAATFIEFLRETRGPDAVRSWLLDPAGPERTFTRWLGATIPEVERAWLNWLDRRAPPAPGHR